VAEFELRREGHIAKGGILCFECFMIVGNQTLWPARVGKGKFSRGIKVAEQNVGDCLSSLIAATLKIEPTP